MSVHAGMGCVLYSLCDVSAVDFGLVRDSLSVLASQTVEKNNKKTWDMNTTRSCLHKISHQYLIMVTHSFLHL